ncbi:class I SAM-dependent methyltransferase [Streptomyces sp. PRKS01-29]|nr:class I SAM-dependent methyltransferase [Streptomyces sabulosicollis]MBI0293381.1 class I SAM-dependent methyltransferase [Streptomyces sabulosicollis]
MTPSQWPPAPAYHRPEHWDRVHHSTGQGPGGRASRALESSVAAAVIRGLPPGGTVLDLACGTGSLLRGLPAEYRGVGMDFSAEALRRAAGAGDPGGIAWIQGDAHRPPLATGSADAVVCLASMWVFADPARVLTEAHRMLRPGGSLVVHLWASPADCRLITLGALSIAQVVETSRLTAGVTGPFELTSGHIDAWARRAGFLPVDWETAECRRTITGIGEYWAEFAALAPTAYDRYERAAAAERRKVRGVLAALLKRHGNGQGAAELPLTWRLGVARRGTDPNGHGRR